MAATATTDITKVNPPATTSAPAISTIQPAILPERRVAAVDFTGRRIHFMGAGGIGVSGLLELCQARGAVVSGCDCSDGGQVARLRAKGVAIASGHHASHVAECDELVYSAAVPETHPELQQAKLLGKAASVRMHTLGELARGLRSICVTGAHGKTTTTWIIAHTLTCAGRDPWAFVGGVVKDLNGNVRIGTGEEFVTETDESDNRLDEVTPSIPVVTNIDADHLDHYGTIENIEQALTWFLASADVSDPQSALVGCGDDVRVRRALETAGARCGRPVISYGFQPHNLVRAANLRPHKIGWIFDARGPFGEWANLHLQMPGEHNVLNALAAISVAWHLKLAPAAVRKALKTVTRVGRRFEFKGIKRGVRVVDDYGHHPTEIELTLRAARAITPGRLGVLFQPHRYSRTKTHLDGFAQCLQQANAIFLLPVYGAGEEPIPGVDHYALASKARAAGHPHVRTFANRADAVAAIAEWAQTGDMVVTQGAGDVTRASDELVSRL